MTYFEDAPPADAASSPAPGRGRGRAVALAVAAVAVVAGAAFAAVNLASGEENNPTDPVRNMIDAAEHHDAIGILEQLDPAERDALRGPLEQLTSELNRLHVLSGASLSHLTGYDLEVQDLQLHASEVRDGLQSVRVDGGKGTYSVDPSKLPLGSFVRDLAGASLAEGKSSGTSDLKSTAAEDNIAVVRRGGRWYVSIGYSVAEAARRSAGISVASLPEGVAAKGAASPEAAVEDLLDAAADLDVRRLVELVPPDEMAALHDYAGLFIADAERSAQMARRSFSIERPKLALDAETDGDRSVVKIRTFELRGTAGGSTFAVKNGCVNFSVPGQGPREVCPRANPSSLFGLYGAGLPAIPAPPTLSSAGKQLDVGFVVTRVDGQWYVSPTRTLLGAIVGFAKVLEPSDLTKLRDWVEGMQQSVEKSLTSSFDETSGSSVSGWTTATTATSNAGGERPVSAAHP